MKNKFHLIFTTAIAMFASPFANAAISTFDNLTLPGVESAYVAGADSSFVSGGVTFNQDWNETFNCCASGWFYSNYTDTTTPGFSNQYSAITGGGVNGSSNYGVANLGDATINFNSSSSVSGAYITNTTYSYLAVQNGDDGAGFVKGPFDNSDFFTLTITGYDATSTATGSVDVQLWDALSLQALDSWLWVDLLGLGVVDSLGFSLSSSDTGSFGMNTPAYFALDDLTVQAVPLPASIWLLLSAFGFLTLKRKTHK
jgi:uncharacterized protein DUF4465